MNALIDNSNSIILCFVSILATWLFSRHFYKRSFLKKLQIFRRIHFRLYGHISADVRRKLRLTFNEEEVKFLTYFEFIVSNSGDQAIAALIKPLRLEFPANVKIVNASTAYQKPDSVDIEYSTFTARTGGQGLEIKFSLINPNDYFLVKLLIDGKIEIDDLCFKLQGENLPNILFFETLPYGATRSKRWSVNWEGMLNSIFTFLVGIGLVICLALLYPHRPELFPYPWEGFKPTIFSITLLVIWFTTIFISVVLTVFLYLPDHLANVIRRPQFPIPEEILEGETLKNTKASSENEIDSKKVAAA